MGNQSVPSLPVPMPRSWWAPAPHATARMGFRVAPF
jgi:hypothetical protein